MRLWYSLLFLSGISIASAQLPDSWELGPRTSPEADRVVFGKGRDALVTLPLAAQSEQVLTLHFKAAPGLATVTFLDGANEAARFMVRKDKDGEVLTLQKAERNPEDGKWRIRQSLPLNYRPGPKAAFVWKNLEAAGLDPKGWHGREVELRFVRQGGHVAAYLDGVLALSCPLAAAGAAQLAVQLGEGDAIAPGKERPLSHPARFTPLSISHWVNGAGKTETQSERKGIPFLRPQEGGGIDLRKAQWPFARDLPSNYFAAYDSGPMYLHDLRTPTLWAPADDYAALHLLVRRSDDGAKLGRRFSVRTGSFGMGALGGRGQVLQLDYHGTVPEEAGEQLVSIPLSEAIAQDLGDTLQFIFNREIYPSRRAPDPSRFEVRPLGLPVGMEILGATLERAPIVLRVSSPEPGNVFEGTREARFSALIENRTQEPQPYEINASATNHDGGEPLTVQASGTLAPGATKEVPLALSAPQWGHYHLMVRLQSGKQTLQRRTTFALLPPDTREHRAQSPFGTWTYSTPSQPGLIGSLMKKAGLRFGMGQFPKERAQWGVQNNFEVKDIKKADKYDKWVADNPDALPVALLMHEHSISADHVTRVPDAFTGRKPYTLNEAEKKRFKDLWDAQIAMGRLMREQYPNVHLRLGNGPLPTKEEFLREKFPADLFDSLGNEAGSFGRLPEAQPPDWVANNAGIWMDHELLKAYGYDKPVTQCYEIMYPSTNPGNLSYRDQAAYFVRHALHSVAWGIPEIRFGLLEDVNSAYRFSNWGASGLVHAAPQSNPKPSYVAVATMTRLLDGAKFRRALDTGSPTVYGVELTRPDGQPVCVFWTVRGEREATVRVSGSGWQWTDWQGNTHAAAPGTDGVELTLSPMPLYLTGHGALEGVSAGANVRVEEPGEGSVVVAALDDLANWAPQAGADPLLENHNPLTPRRLGRFDYSVDAAESAIKVHANDVEGPAAIPMYSILAAKTPVELPGKPTELGLQVMGNSGWGRVIYELEDAGGQKWTSIGASRKGEISEWMLDWLPAEFAKAQGQAATQADWNTNDLFGASAINFDGWRYLRFPLPGNYPGEGNPWPANSQWRWDGDGVVKYPLKLTRLIFEMPANVLKLTEFSPVKDKTIAVRGLRVGYGTGGAPKQGVYEDEL